MLLPADAQPQFRPTPLNERKDKKETGSGKKKTKHFLTNTQILNKSLRDYLTQQLTYFYNYITLKLF